MLLRSLKLIGLFLLVIGSVPAMASQELSLAESVPSARVSLGMGYSVWGSSPGIGFNTSATFLVANNFYVGGEVGYNGWSMSKSRHLTYSIPILATGLYRREILNSRLYFLAGLSVGVNLHELEVVNPPSGTRSTGVYFEGYARTGLEYDFTRSFGLSVEPKIGILDKQLLVATELHAVVHF